MEVPVNQAFSCKKKKKNIGRSELRIKQARTLLWVTVPNVQFNLKCCNLEVSMHSMHISPAFLKTLFLSDN